MRQGMAVCDDNGTFLVELDVEDCAAVCPGEARMPANLDEVNIMNLKWSPDGERFFCVFTDEIFRRELP